MDHDGQRRSTTPSAMLASLLSRRAKLQEERRNIERQVYDMETSYLQDPGQCGYVLKGFGGFLASSENTGLSLLSLVTSPAVFILK
ncbi:chromatin modification-related protein MEAF6-like isoform X2 [Durio zibethinus]|uniref:Chromatin modification-related protein MEAF6-like isoform X2 n=1 Tax=Durio zibethinus TaxID=66656 RepID=A0A6P6AYJ9_DURZI|nr:chromatin modification-related protein MEAF6-like isoform X2 [Durio zibethinus]